MQKSLQLIAAADAGVLIYLRGQEGRGIGLNAKLTAYALQDKGRDTIEANEDQGLPVDARRYDAVAHILADLRVDAVRLLTNNPAKCEALEALGVRVAERIPVLTAPTPLERLSAAKMGLVDSIYKLKGGKWPMATYFWQ